MFLSTKGSKILALAAYLSLGYQEPVFAVTDSYTFSIKQAGEYISDKAFLEKVSGVEPNLGSRLGMYATYSAAEKASVLGGYSVAGGLIGMAVIGVLEVVSVGGKQPFSTTPMGGVLGTATFYSLVLGTPLLLGSSITMQYSAPGRQFDVKEAKIAAQRFNQLQHEEPEIVIVTPSLK